MTAPFDMYREWLGVAEERRPPTCYGILDLEQGEARPEVIEQHARMQKDKLAPYRHGLHAEFTVRLAHEIDVARSRLLEISRHAGYNRPGPESPGAMRHERPVWSDRAPPTPIPARPPPLLGSVCAAPQRANRTGAGSSAAKAPSPEAQSASTVATQSPDGGAAPRCPSPASGARSRVPSRILLGISGAAVAILLVLLPWWLAATPHSEDVNGPLQRRTEDRLAESDEDAGLEPFSDDDLGCLESEDWLDLPPLAEADAQPKGGGRGTCVEEEDATEHDDKATVEPEDAGANDNDMDAGEKGVVADDQPDQHAVPMPQQEQDAADEANNIPDAGHEPERLQPPAGIAFDDEGAWDLGEAARRAREAHEDCPACDGKGFRYARCKNRMCARGTVRGYQHQVIGVHPLTGDPIIQRIPIRVPCPTCRGNHITKTRCSRCWGRGVP